MQPAMPRRPMESASTGGKDQNTKQLGQVPMVVSSTDLVNGRSNNTNTRHIVCHHAELRAVDSGHTHPCLQGPLHARTTYLQRFGVLLSIFNAANIGNSWSYSCTTLFHACIHRLHSTKTSDGCEPFNSGWPQRPPAHAAVETCKNQTRLLTRACLVYRIQYAVNATIARQSSKHVSSKMYSRQNLNYTP